MDNELYNNLLERAKRYAHVRVVDRIHRNADGSTFYLYEKERPTIKLLETLSDTSPEYRAHVLAHELGHVTAKDTFKHRVGYLLNGLQDKIKTPVTARVAAWVNDNVPVIGKPLAQYGWYGGRVMMESAANDEGLRHLKELGADKKLLAYARKDGRDYVAGILRGER